jgi:pimeloyl-ACP methyl ester carboxylesterase
MRTVIWLWLGIGLILGIVLTIAFLAWLLFIYLRWRYLEYVVRIFQEKPIFIIPRGQPVPEAEEIRFRTVDGLTLCGCYLRATNSWKRQGVILFGLEYASNRWSCLPYCEHLLAAGFDVFTFECRNQGDSDRQPGYEPLQWVTNHEVEDFQAALSYLKSRSDGDSRGIGFFGISKGGGAGLLAAARDPFVRCFVTDGIFATHTTMIPYMRRWISIYSDRYWIQELLPTCFYAWMGHAGLRQIGQERGCRFPHLEHVMSKLSPRPLLMIHGGSDTYIKPDMARKVFERARPPKEFWLVEGAKHNQAIQVAGEEYQQRVLDFFLEHLAGIKTPAERTAARETGSSTTSVAAGSNGRQ